MKKIILSKKHKIVAAVITGVLCVGGVGAYTVISNNMQNESEDIITNIEL